MIIIFYKFRVLPYGLQYFSNVFLSSPLHTSNLVISSPAQRTTQHFHLTNEEAAAWGLKSFPPSYEIRPRRNQIWAHIFCLQISQPFSHCASVLRWQGLYPQERAVGVKPEPGARSEPRNTELGEVGDPVELPEQASVLGLGISRKVSVGHWVTKFHWPFWKVERLRLDSGTQCWWSLMRICWPERGILLLFPFRKF